MKRRRGHTAVRQITHNPCPFPLSRIPTDSKSTFSISSQFSNPIKGKIHPCIIKHCIKTIISVYSHFNTSTTKNIYTLLLTIFQFLKVLVFCRFFFFLPPYRHWFQFMSVTHFLEISGTKSKSSISIRDLRTHQVDSLNTV